MSAARIALITGASQGLGFALAEGLAARMRPGDLVLRTGRDEGRVAAAVDRISGATARVYGRVLDVTDGDAVHHLADDLRGHGGVNIVFSNAGARMTPHRPLEAEVDAVVETYKPRRHPNAPAFAPILGPRGRFLVVASSFGTLCHLDPRLRPLLENATIARNVLAVIGRLRALPAAMSGYMCGAWIG